MRKFDEMNLIARCVLADDRHAFGLLVEAYRPRVVRFFLNLTQGNTAWSDDLAQETFIKAYLNLRSFKGVASFSTWLYRIAYNEFYSDLRRHRLTEEIDELHDTTASDTMAGVEAALTVQEAMAQLGATERMMVTLFYLEDQPIKKIVQITGLPEGTVKSHLHRAKQKMQHFIDN
ncbi:MAG: sigma-70 family RNA polymerase sigma factor [Muribaculaceae bacterium]|nr:sigma-70 family RNA polymerase sigma factor [Muribaculaceae bacterium]